MENIKINKQVQVIDKYDVVVCGGGPAGFIAAIAAARQGMRVALAERYGYLGGMATSALVNPISRFKKNGETVVNGIPLEFVKKLEDMGGAVTDYETGHVPFDAEKYKILAQRMVVESGVTMYLHSTITDVVCKNGNISHIILENKGGTMALEAKCVIDCTGDADVANKAGVPMLPMPETSEIQPASICFRLGGVDVEKLHGFRPSKLGVRSVCDEVREVLLKLSDTQNVPEFGGPWFCSVMLDEHNICGVNITRTALDVTEGNSMTNAEIKLRENVHTFVDLLRENIPAFKNCFLLMTGAQVGVRESRRIKGHYVLTEEKYISGYEFDDSIARGAHPLDIHKAGGAGQDIVDMDIAPHIPYGSLYADGFDNIIVAGRCISAERRPFASIRVQATVMALGEAAGIAAALAVKNKASVSDIPIKKLQEILTDSGAII